MVSDPRSASLTRPSCNGLKRTACENYFALGSRESAVSKMPGSFQHGPDSRTETPSLTSVGMATCVHVAFPHLLAGPSRHLDFESWEGLTTIQGFVHPATLPMVPNGQWDRPAVHRILHLGSNHPACPPVAVSSPHILCRQQSHGSQQSIHASTGYCPPQAV